MTDKKTPVFIKVETFDQDDNPVSDPLMLNYSIDADRQRFRRHCDWALRNNHNVDVSQVDA